MKYLLKYSLFREKIEKNITDSASLSTAKDSVNQKQDWITQFNAKKSQIDSLYNVNQDYLDEEKIKTQLDQLKVSDNPLLQEYVKVQKLHYDVKKLKDKQSDEEVRMSKFKSDIPTLSRDLEKKNMQAEVDRLKKSIDLSTQDLVKKQKEIQDSELEMKKKLDELQKENEEDIKKISEEDKK
jgi:NhaP-type Na+/H+ and K+/H+ antiporter